MNECDQCGRELYQTFAGDYYEPAEYECPTCDGGMDPHEADGWDEPDLDAVEDMDREHPATHTEGA